MKRGAVESQEKKPFFSNNMLRNFNGKILKIYPKNRIAWKTFEKCLLS